MLRSFTPANRRGRFRRRLWTSTCALLGTALIATVSAQEPQPAQPKFATGAEVVLVDVSVVSGNGEPVNDLTAADFKLTVNGQPRPVHTVQFISTREMKAANRDPRLAHVSSNDGPSTGRLLLFVIDENYLRLGGARAVLRTAERVMTGLASGDAVGVARLPTGRGGVEFTTDRERVRRALGSVMGAQPMRPTDNVRLSEAHAYETGDTGTWDQVIERECGSGSSPGVAGGSLARELCIDQLHTEARNVVVEASARSRVSISALEQMAARLAALKMPVNIVFISEGLYVGRDRNDLTSLARLAASARLTFYVIQPDESLGDNDKPRVTGGFAQEAVLSEGLEQIAGLTRGSYFKLATSGEGAFDRISRELSGYYLLSFEPTDQDRTSRERRIKVEVSRRGLTVKSRATYALNETAAAKDVTSMPAEEQVKALLAAPMPTPGLPMRVATYAVTSAEANRVRVVISAEIGDAATSAAEWPVGILVFNSQDKIFIDSTRYMTLDPITTLAPSPRLLTMTMVLEPGEYSLRLAAVDHEGKSGSVHHTVDARLHRIAGDAVRASDLMISSDLMDGRVPRPVPTAVQHTELMYSILELTGDRGRVSKSRVTVQVADDESAAALVSVDARPLPGGEGSRSFAAVLKLGVLPPGEYVARAVIKVPGQADAVVARPFRLAPIAAVTIEPMPAPPSRSVDEPPAPLPAAKVAVPVSRFSVDEVLTPQTVRPFIEYLQREHPVSAGNAAVMEQALNGTYTNAGAENTAPGDAVSLAFVRGLALLQKKEYAQAAGWFQTALKNASDFLGAAFYLGAVHAALGRDNDAIGAWQMATIGENSDPVYPVLVDALLRIGDAQGALDMIAEVPEAWPSDDERMKRAATAQAMLGQFEAALESLDDLLQRHGSDQDLLFVAIQVLYRQHGVRPLSAPERARFDDYSKRYVANTGPESALVQTWRRFVLR
jgi:VWFA-related protein